MYNCTAVTACKISTRCHATMGNKHQVALPLKLLIDMQLQSWRKPAKS